MERLKKALINPKSSIKDALKQMDANGEKTLIVVDEDGILLGTVSDGDIRRWILKGGDLAEAVSRVMNQNPVTLEPGFNKEKAKNLFVGKTLECLPIVDARKKVVSAVWWVDLFKSEKKKFEKLDIPVVIMAGGEGARLAPLTSVLPKALMPVGEKPIIEIIIERFLNYGCNDFYISLNYKSSIIKAYFNDFEHKYNISYIQEEKPLGTAGSLTYLDSRIESEFFLSNCDILVEADYADILEFHRQKKNLITIVGSIKNFTVPYGVCEIENGGILKGINEKPEFDFVVNTGMYVIDRGALKDIPKDKFFDMTDLIAAYLERGKKVGVYPVSEKSWLDMGRFEALQDMLKKFEMDR